MKKIFLLIAILLTLTITNVQAQFVQDVIVTSSNGIWTDSRAYATLNDAVTAVGANKRTIVISSQHTVTSLTIPSTVTLRFERDGSIANSAQLTINTKNIEADNHQIFTGVGNIDFASGTIVKSTWFQNIETAFALTSNDTITLLMTAAHTVTASYSPGNNVLLKWDSPGNVLTVNAGVTVGNLKLIEAGSYQIFGGAGDFDFLDGTYLKSVWFNRLRSAVSWIESEDVIIELTFSETLDMNLTIPTNIILSFNNTILSGAFTLAFSGSFNDQVKCLPSQQIFGSTTTVTFGIPSTINPKQWGVKGDYSTDDTTAMQAALVATAGKGKFFIPNGGYVISTSLALPQNSNGRALLDLTIEGESRADTVLINAAAANNATIQDAGTTRGLLIKNISFVGKTANPNRGIQLSVVESSRFTNLSFDTYGDGIYVTNHAMDVEFDHLFFWWDILSDVLGYTTTIRYTSLTQGYSAIKICNGEADGATYWANHVRFDNIWTNGGAYGINSRPKTSLMLIISNCGFDSWAANDGSKTGHNVPIYLENAYQSVVRDSYLNSNTETATNRLIILKNCRNILLEKIHDDLYDPTAVVANSTSSIRLEGSTTDNIVQRDLDCSGSIDIHSDVNAYATVNYENCRYTGGFTTVNRYPSYMSSFYARNLYIETEGYTASGNGFIDTEQPKGVYTLANSATPSIVACHQADATFLTGGTTTITKIEGGQRVGHKITIIAAHAVTLDYGAAGGNLIINGAVDFVMVVGDTITLIRQSDGNWYEVSRSVNHS